MTFYIVLHFLFMETREAIKTRRSIRSYEQKSISDTHLHLILEAGMYAPSAYNQQPWHFVVIKDKQKLYQIPTIHPYAQMTSQADCAILVCADMTIVKRESLRPQDCSACVQNMLLMTHDLWLWAVWCAIYPEEQRIVNFRNLCNLPSFVIPFALIPLWYPAEPNRSVDRRRPERIHYEVW